MAEWYGSARSNYFRVKDIDEFRKLCKLWNITLITDEKNPPRVGFLCENNNGGLPNYRYEDSECGEEFDFDYFLSELSALLMDDEVAVMVEAGVEKLCYVTGCAVAINSKGDKCSISLDEIYERAKAIGENITKAES